MGTSCILLPQVLLANPISYIVFRHFCWFKLYFSLNFTPIGLSRAMTNWGRGGSLVEYHPKFYERCGMPPQRNGQAEAANKQILLALQKKLEEHKGIWADLVPEVLRARILPKVRIFILTICWALIMGCLALYTTSKLVCLAGYQPNRGWSLDQLSISITKKKSHDQLEDDTKFFFFFKEINFELGTIWENYLKTWKWLYISILIIGTSGILF